MKVKAVAGKNYYIGEWHTFADRLWTRHVAQPAIIDFVRRTLETQKYFVGDLYGVQLVIMDVSDV